MILLIDNYDSFTYNLAQLIAEEQEVKVVRNDEEKLFDLAAQASAIVISPGPGTPAETGYVKEIIHRYYKEKPFLGICLGHQTLGEFFGGKVISATHIRHGKVSNVRQENSRLFYELPKEFPVMRYHSLVIDSTKQLKEFNVTGVATDDQEIMAMEHERYPIFGVQFHPESIGTPNGKKMIRNFIQLMEEKTDEASI